ncbi:M3 family oligoendopeptidase [Candidatus Sumerlaeota bacterium]|nr:M3 family oligoendopeptidase [Candidatus Sumerlaeota bacterium]
MTTKIKPVRGEEFPRAFTAQVNDFGQWSQLEPLFQELQRHGKAVDSPESLEKWLLEQSELAAALDEEESRRSIAMTCQTDDEQLERAYLDFLENVEPKAKPYWDRLRRQYLDSEFRQKLPRKRYEVLERDAENDVKLYREENVPLQTEDAKLAQQYQKICGAMMVTYDGEERTLQQMAPYLEENDRKVREEVWKLVAARRLEDRDTVNENFDRMIGLRTKIARNAGFRNFRDYQHQARARFDYTPEDCVAFQDAIAEVVVPLLAKARQRRRDDLGAGALRPWDLAVDPKGRPPLRPFKTGAELEEGCERIFRDVDGDLGDQFSRMRSEGLLDLESRKGKAPGGYQSSLEEVRYPFIFMNAAGTDRDLFTLLHEGGHAFHAFAAREEPLLFYRHAPIEFCEVASMSMEMFAYDHLGAFYSEEEAGRSRRHHLEQLLALFPWIATIDSFQHWIYLNPEHSREEREEKWLEIENRFSPAVDWSGLEADHRSLWQRQLHLFQVPFYYVEYGIAQLGALQLWMKHKENPREAVAGYRKALALGGTRPLPELFEAAGARFDFSVGTLRPIMEAIGEELEREAS